MAPTGNLVRRAPSGAYGSAGRVYLVALLLSLFLVLLKGRWAGGRTLVAAASEIRYVFLFVLAYRALIDGRERLGFAVAMLFEVVVGFLGFHAAFKKPIMIALTAALAAYGTLRWRGRQLAVAVACGLLLAAFSVLWMAMRPMHREFLQAEGDLWGHRDASAVERLRNSADILARLDATAMASGVTAVSERASYVDYFAVAYHRVPARQAHEHGALLMSALKHIVHPRLLFPDKEALTHDSDIVRKYAGVRVAGLEQGTSISLGYIPEAYVDWGVPGMFVPIFAYGFLLATLAAAILKLGGGGRVALGCATVVVLFSTAGLETSTAKLLGATLMGAAVLGTLAYGWGRHLRRRTAARAERSVDWDAFSAE